MFESLLKSLICLLMTFTNFLTSLCFVNVSGDGVLREGWLVSAGDDR